MFLFCSAVFCFVRYSPQNIQDSHFHGELFSIRASAQEKEEARKGGKKCFVTASGLHFKCFPLLRSVLGAGTQHVRFLRGYRTLDKHWIPKARYTLARSNLPFHKSRKEKEKRIRGHSKAMFCGSKLNNICHNNPCLASKNCLATQKLVQ